MTDPSDYILQATYGSRLVALREFQLQNSCVETTRLLLLTLERLGITYAKPQAVNVRVFNTLGLQMVEEGIPVDQWPPAAYAMGTDPNPEAEAANPNGWAGHLVAVLRRPRGGRHLIDASSDQFNRPGSLNVPGPVGVGIDGLWSPMDPQYRVLADGETIIEYRPLIGERAKEWREFPAWVKDPEWFGQQADAIAKQVLEGWTYVPQENGTPA